MAGKKKYGKIAIGVCAGALALYGLYKLFNPPTITPLAESELKQTIGEGVSNAGLGYFTMPIGQEGVDSDGKKYRMEFHDKDFSKYGGKIISDNEIIMPMSVEKGNRTSWYYVRARGHEIVSIQKKGMIGGGCSMPSYKQAEKEQPAVEKKVKKTQTHSRDTRDFNKARKVKSESCGLWEKGVVPYAELDEITSRMETFIQNCYSIPEIGQTKKMFEHNPRLAAACLQVLCEKGLETKIQQFYPKDFNRDGTEDLAVLVQGQVIFLTSRSDGFQINKFSIDDPQCEYTPRWNLGETRIKFNSGSELTLLDKLNANNQISAGWGGNAPNNINDINYCITLRENVWVNNDLKPVALDWFYITPGNRYYRLQAVLNPSRTCHTPSYTFGRLNTNEDIAKELIE